MWDNYKNIIFYTDVEAIEAFLSELNRLVTKKDVIYFNDNKKFPT